MLDKEQTDPRRKWTIEVVSTFVTLMHAHERRKFSTAAAAQDELKRLGVGVRLDPPSSVRAQPQDGRADG